MTAEKEARQHLYSRPPLDPNAEDSLAKIARQITSGAAILDIGCAVGELGRYLTEQKHCVVDGIEANPDAAAIARSSYRRVWEADLETASMEELLGESRYQYIVCADVLEHLRDPGQLLRQIANFLAPSGKLLVSIPNIAHVGVFLELFSGDFRYREEGLLDRTHLRFFTRRSFLHFLADNGFAGQVVDRTIVDLQQSEFAAIPLETISPSLLREMQGWDDNITYQFIVEAHPQEIGENVTPIFPLDKAASHGPRFACQVFWRSQEAESFTETLSKRILLPIGLDRQRVDFALPKEFIQALRFDPSGQRGFLRLYAMRLLDGADCLWTWDGHIETLLRGTLHGIFPAPLKTGEEGVVLSLLDEDPWLELPVPPEILSRAERLEVELSWPMSADYMAVQEEWEDLLKQNQRLATELEAMHQSNEAQTGELTTALQAAEEQNQRQNRELEEMRSSRSWQITLPMRVVVTRFRHGARIVGLSLGVKHYTRIHKIGRKIYHALPLPQEIKKRMRSKVINLLPAIYTSENVGGQASIPHLAPRADDYSLVVPFGYSVETWENTPRIAVICHLFYTDLADEIRGYLENIPFPFDLIITTDDHQKVAAIEDAFENFDLGNLEIRIAQNRGRDIAPKLITCKDVYDHYEFILYIHTKKSPHDDILYSWRNHLLETLIGSNEIVESIFEMFRANKSLGMVAPSHFNAIKHAIGWGWNTIEVKKIATRMGIMIREEGRVDFPSGSMFWTRSSALKPLLELGVTVEDFPPEGGQIDGTLAHVMERLFFLSCERAGYHWYFITTSHSATEKERVKYVSSKKGLLDFMEKYRYDLLEPVADGLYHNIISPSLKTPSTMATLDEQTCRKAYTNSDLFKKIDFIDFQRQLELFLSNQESMIDFDEQFYLTVNRDVAQAVLDGAIHCGYIHFLLNGHLEKRLWSNRQLRHRFNLTPMFPEGFFAPVNICPLTDYKPIVHSLRHDGKPALLILIGHLQEDLFFAGYAEFFQDLSAEYEKFEKVYVAVEAASFNPSLVTRYANNIEAISDSRIEDIKHVPSVIICHNSRLFAKAKKLFGDTGRLVYYCQDYEAGFSPYGSAYVEAERAIWDAPHLIISTEILRKFFEERKLLQETQHIFVTRPRIEIFDVLPEKNGRIFFYFRPEKFNSRNLSEILMEAAIKFAGRRSGYEIYLVGCVETRFSFEVNGTHIFVINKLPKEEYLRLISSCDAVVACIYSAHPGVIAFQAAASGIPTVTNVFRNRTAELLKEISENIVPYDPIRDDLVERIEEALSRPKGNKSFRQDLYGGTQEGSLSEFVDDILFCTVEQ